MLGQLQVLRRLAGKCACALTKEKATEFFAPFQFGVACPGGTEKIIHRLRQTVEDHWQDADFAVLKIDMQNAFNLVSRDAVLKQCAIHFPELLPWVSWCYSQHQYLWHPMGQLISASGVQQGDPLGPLLFALVLNDTIIKIHYANLYNPTSGIWMMESCQDQGQHFLGQWK